MREGSSLDRFRQGMFRDFHRGLRRLGPAGPKALQWFSATGREGLARLRAIKEVLKRHLLSYALGCMALLGGGFYWAWQMMNKQAQGASAPLKTQIYVYGRAIAGSIFSPVTDPISIAEVHATIISIFLGALVAYALYSYGVLREAEEAIFQEADRVNTIPVAGIHGAIGRGIYVSSEPNNRQALGQRFLKLSMGFSRSPIPGFDDLPTEPAARGQELLTVISALAAYYPFSLQVQPIAEGGMPIGAREPLIFTNIKELRQWVSDVEPVASTVVFVLNVHPSKLRESLEAYFAQQTSKDPILPPRLHEKLSTRLTPGEMDDLLRMSQTAADRTTILRNQADAILHQIVQTGDIAQSVKFKLQQLDAAKKRLPMRAVIISLLGAGIAFGCGVMLPMFWQRVPTLFFLLIPSIFYIITFIYAALFMWKLLKVESL